jgi:hypothetical protein
MDDEALVANLERVASELGLPVRYELCEDGPGGLCRLHDQQVIIVHSGFSAGRRAEVLAAALSEADTEGVFMMPAVREAIERARRPAS